MQCFLNVDLYVNYIFVNVTIFIIFIFSSVIPLKMPKVYHSILSRTTLCLIYQIQS